MPMHDRHKEWLKGRKIDPDLAERFGLSTISAEGKNWLAVPYVEHGRTVNHKYRLTQAKDHRMDRAAALTLWNHDCLLSEPETVVITEGEWDALAAIQSGFANTLSVPNGAPKHRTEGAIDPEHDAERYAFLWRARDLLDKVSRFIIATDADEPGRVLAHELVRRIGPERCWHVVYPDGCKDLNEVLCLSGEGAVAAVINSAKPYPVKGLYRMSEFPEPPPMQAIQLHIPGADEAPQLVLGTLMVWTGFAGSGKTSLLMFLVADLMKRGVCVAMGSFETQIKPILQRKLRAAICGEWEQRMTPERVAAADALIERNFVVMCQDVADEDHEMTLEELLEMCRVAVLRDGARLIVIDPWNEIEHKRRPDESESDYTGRAIRAIKAFARLYDVAIWIVAHPKKPMQWGQKPAAPGLYDISGSAHWANKADYGAVIHRPNKQNNLTELVFCKVRMGLPGREQTVKLEWQWTNSSYVPAHGVLEEIDE